MLATQLVWLAGGVTTIRFVLTVRLALFVIGPPAAPLTTTRYTPALAKLTFVNIRLLPVCPPNAPAPKYH